MANIVASSSSSSSSFSTFVTLLVVDDLVDADDSLVTGKPVVNIDSNTCIDTTMPRKTMMHVLILHVILKHNTLTNDRFV